MEWRSLLRKGSRASDEAPLLGASAAARRLSRCGPAAKCRPGPGAVVPQFAATRHQHLVLLDLGLPGHRVPDRGRPLRGADRREMARRTPDKILQRTDNPTGHAVVCWTPQRGIVCFIRATES